MTAALKPLIDDARDVAVRVRAAFEADGARSDALLAWSDYLFLVAMQRDRQHDMVEAVRWRAGVVGVRNYGTRYSLHRWFEARAGARVETMQIDSQVHLWRPGPRTVNQVRPTFVELDGSRRYFRECSVIGATSNCIIVAAPDQVCAYRTAHPITGGRQG